VPASTGACFVGDPAVRASGANATSPANVSVEVNGSTATPAGQPHREHYNMYSYIYIYIYMLPQTPNPNPRNLNFKPGAVPVGTAVPAVLNTAVGCEVVPETLNPEA